MIARKLMPAFVAMSITILLCSCGPETYKLYPGDLLPQDKIAILLNRVDSSVGFGEGSTDIVRIVSVDSNTLKPQAPGSSPDQKIEILPGQCTVVAFFRGSRNENTTAFGTSYFKTTTLYGPPQEITFSAKPGCVYQTGYHIEAEPVDGQQTKWKLTINQISGPPSLPPEHQPASSGDLVTVGRISRIAFEGNSRGWYVCLEFTSRPGEWFFVPPEHVVEYGVFLPSDNPTVIACGDIESWMTILFTFDPKSKLYHFYEREAGGLTEEQRKLVDSRLRSWDIKWHNAQMARTARIRYLDKDIDGASKPVITYLEWAD
jgi:hypothetical protein